MAVDEHNGILLPPGALAPLPANDGGHAVVINETGLPDAQIQAATQTFFAENASVNGLAMQPSTFGVHSANQGSLLARTEYRTPTNIIEEIKLARELAERDDDIGSVIGSMIAMAFGEGMENFHDDERTVSIFNEVARQMNLDRVLREMYREYLISYQINSVSLFTRATLEYSMVGSATDRSDSVAWPLVGIMPAEQIRILDNDMFGNGTLACLPENEAQRMWLDEFFNPDTSPARKHDMAVKDRVMAAMYTGVVEVNPNEIFGDPDLVNTHNRLYTLNPRIVHRTTGPKGAWKYPRPLLTRNFALLEAKRLLNLMDYALLQGGANFVVVAKKGTDQRPAQPAELENLREVVRGSSRSGVIVGDHRLTFDVITPDLKELLNPEKRKLIGRKLARALLRLPELDEEGGSEGTRLDAEFIQRVVANDRHEVKRHVERTTYFETRRRNPNTLNGAPALWFPKIILQGTNYFNDLVLKLRDRGDIPRGWAVSAAGFPWQAAVQARKREVEAGDDDVMTPAQVPFNSPDAGPQDNNQGRPPGGRDDRPRQRVTQNAGETVRAMFVEELGTTVRIGDITHAILDEHPDYEQGRVSRIERELLEGGEEEAVQRATSMYVPVNPGYECAEYQALNLTPNLRLIIGDRKRDRAKVAKLIVFRESEYDEAAAESTAVRWGFPVRMPEQESDVPTRSGQNPEEFAEALGAALSKMPAPVVNVEIQNGGKKKKTVERDPDTGEIIGSTEEPVE